MNVSEITDERLKHIANGGSWMSDHPEILALAQAELDRREKVEVVKSVKYWKWIYDDVGPSFYRKTLDMICIESKDKNGRFISANGSFITETAEEKKWWIELTQAEYDKPTERAEIEPSQTVIDAIQMESIEQRLHNLALSFNGLLNRMDAVENEMRKR